MWKWLLVLVLGVVVFQSRIAGSEWLTGWDNLHPEFDWRLNIARALSGGWQEYQGVGLPGGMAHIADLPRLLVLWGLDLVLPTNWVRWVWHMLMLTLGPLGVWYLGKKVGKWRDPACLAASLFYLLNLATLQ